MSLPLNDEGASRSNIMDSLPEPPDTGNSIAGTRNLPESSNYLFTPWIGSIKIMNWDEIISLLSISIYYYLNVHQNNIVDAKNKCYITYNIDNISTNKFQWTNSECDRNFSNYILIPITVLRILVQLRIYNWYRCIN